jgi:hypothetical protein
MTWIIDRIEGDLAVVIYADLSFDVPLRALPEGLSEGDALRIEASDDAAATLAEAKKKLAALAQADDGEDFSL